MSNFIQNEVVNLEAGEAVKEAVILHVPVGTQYTLEFLGVNAFAPSAELFVSLEVAVGGQ